MLRTEVLFGEMAASLSDKAPPGENGTPTSRRAISYSRTATPGSPRNREECMRVFSRTSTIVERHMRHCEKWYDRNLGIRLPRLCLIDEVNSHVTKLVDMDALAAVSGGSVSRNIWKAC